MDPVTGGAAIAAAVIAVTGGVTSLVNNYEVADQLEDYIKYLDQLYALDVKDANEKFAAAKAEAEKNAAQANKRADISDVGQDITETALSQDFNATIDNLYLGQQQNLLDWNAQAMNAGKSEGATLAGLAGSGIRAGSSLSEAVKMESAVNSQQLQFSQDAARRTESNQLGKILTNLAGTKVDIYGNRVEADTARVNALDLVNSYAEGGSNWNIYNNNLVKMKTSYEYNRNKLQDEIDDRRSFWGGVKAFFGGAASGYTAGHNITSMIAKDVMAFDTKGKLATPTTGNKNFSGFRSL